MDITRNSLPTNQGPANWFTGAVFVDPIATPSEHYPVNASNVHFTPGARTAWHTHPNGQTIYVFEGKGRVGHRGAPVEEVAPGDRVFFSPGEEHWHGAAPDRFMSHLSIVVPDKHGTSATWGDHVTDEEYNAR